MAERLSHRQFRLIVGLFRPKTLLSGLASVLSGVFYAYAKGNEIDLLITILLFVVAISAQSASNIVNDLVDYRKGADTSERKGPTRPLSQGLLSEETVKFTLYCTLFVLLISGAWLIFLTPPILIVIAIAVVVGLFAYSAGPYPLSYNGLGEVAALIFFGWIPVVTSYYILTGDWHDWGLWLIATSMGLSSANILLVNNYRDYEEDKRSGKRTLLVRSSRGLAPILYRLFGLLSCLLLYPFLSAWGSIGLLIYLALFMQADRSLNQNEGTALNNTLALTARNAIILALLIGFLLWMQAS